MSIFSCRICLTYPFPLSLCPPNCILFSPCINPLRVDASGHAPRSCRNLNLEPCENPRTIPQNVPVVRRSLSAHSPSLYITTNQRCLSLRWLPTNCRRYGSEWVRGDTLPRHRLTRLPPFSGIGYGCCKRLLVQLCQLNPPDARPQAFASHISSDEKAPAGYKGLTLIMACRNRKRAETARTKLLRWFDGQVETLRRLPNYDEDYVSNFLRNCHVEIEELDLASVSSVLNFSAVVHQK